MKRLKPSIVRKLVVFSVISMILLAAGHFIPVRTSTVISKCGTGIAEIYHDSIVFQLKSISEWQQEIDSQRQLLSVGQPFCVGGTNDTPITSKLYIF